MDGSSGQMPSPVIIPSSRIARYAAFWLDGLIVAIIDILVEFVIRPSLLVHQILIRFLLGLFYFIVLTALNGQTLGKRFFGLKVTSVDGNKVGLGRVLLRETIGRLVVLITFSIGYLWIIWDKNRQGWHDKIAGTRVVELHPLSGIKKAIAYVIALLVVVLVTLGLVSIALSTLLLVGLNPANRSALTGGSVYSQSNNTKRASDVNAILNSIQQYSADNNNSISGLGISSDGVAHQISNNGTDGEANICSGLIPIYMAALPVDPKLNQGDFKGVEDCSTSYDTGYKVSIGSNGRVTVSAPNAELSETISVTR